MTPATLLARLEANFPPAATCWSQATDEVRDMARYCREALDLSELHAVNFRACKTPSEWNTHGNASIVRHYTKMTESQRVQFRDHFDFPFLRG